MVTLTLLSGCSAARLDQFSEGLRQANREYSQRTQENLRQAAEASKTPTPQTICVKVFGFQQEADYRIVSPTPGFCPYGYTKVYPALESWLLRIDERAKNRSPLLDS